MIMKNNDCSLIHDFRIEVFDDFMRWNIEKKKEIVEGVSDGEMVEKNRIECLSDVRVEMIETNEIGNSGCSRMLMVVVDGKRRRRRRIIDVDDGMMNEMRERIEEVGDE